MNIEIKNKKKTQISRIHSYSNYLYVLPTFIWLIIFFIIPILVLVGWYSFHTGYVFLGATNQTTSYRSSEIAWSLENYKIFLFHQNYAPIRILFLRTAMTSLIIVIICFILGYPVAYFLSSPRKIRRHQMTLIGFVLPPYLAGYIVRIYGWKVILGNQGVINTFLIYFRVINKPLEFLLYGQFSVYLTLVYIYLPLMIFPIFISLQSLNKSLLEAADDLGANPIKTFLRVTLPLSAPGVLAGFILVFIPVTGAYLEPMLVGGKDYQVMFGSIIRFAFGLGFDWSMGSTASVFLLIFAFIITYLFIKFVGLQRIFGEAG